jgi:hypothetical protein
MNRHVAAGVIMAGLGLSWGSGVQAEEAGWYFALSGALTSTSVSNSDIDNELLAGLEAGLNDQGLLLTGAGANSDLDDSDAGWGVHIGYRFNSWVAAEIGYLDLGEFVQTSELDLLVDDGAGGLPEQEFLIDNEARLASKGIFASVVGMFAINPRFDVHVRGGVLFADTRNRLQAVLVGIPDSFISEEFKDDSRDFFAGVGATWNINDSYALRVEYMKFLDVGDESTFEADIDSVNVAILFR